MRHIVHFGEKALTRLTSWPVNIQRVHEFFNHVGNDNGPFYSPAGNYLFCDSNFLVYQSDDTQTLDFQANDIVDSQGNLVCIADVPAYMAALDEDINNDDWWSGDLTPVNGYYFSTTGSEYCDGTKLGLTAVIQPLMAGPNGQAQEDDPISSIVLCERSFTPSPAPNDTYRDANAQLAMGTNLADVVPKSSTLLHKGFHLVFGAGRTGFLQADEICRYLSHNTRDSL